VLCALCALDVNDDAPTETDPNALATGPCRHCGVAIQAAALYCRHCRQWRHEPFTR
jgi:hypothetical protein